MWLISRSLVETMDKAVAEFRSAAGDVPLGHGLTSDELSDVIQQVASDISFMG
ncbi:hypothetical protein [Shinella sp.]|uniref:hypothetical protein n=1 Tax=Shinella sp. TaxID=1870904 RepID=UPI0039E33C79